PGAAAGRMVSLGNPPVSAFPDMAVRAACASSFSRFARRSLALRPAHSRRHPFVTRISQASAISSPPQLLRLLPAGAVAGWALHPLESAALSRRTPGAVISRPPHRQERTLNPQTPPHLRCPQVTIIGVGRGALRLTKGLRKQH